ncbi:MAG TPA: hypothetical protein VKE88_02400 [Candidatus Nanoarchaeia archaeon]|jgi:hypothetical protein|nr:hypothetical protein [Candidatus Nanoarchaeia archaeon]
MGEIISSKVREDGKIIFEVSVGYEEAKQLKGNLNRIHIFSEDVADVQSNIAQRGKNDATKYFLIPKELRKNMKITNIPVGCQLIETNSKIMFIYVVDKFNT